MACGCPACRKLQRDVAMYIQGNRNIKSLANILKILVYKPEIRQAMKEKGLEQVKKFSWSHTAQATMQAFENILEI